MLRDLWRQRARNLAAAVANGSREHREINHAASLIRQDYNDRFLVELLQNANDQARRGEIFDSTVVVIRTERLLAVSNGGQVVTQSNLERLSSLADSDKDGVLIGNKGVGFKAVYQVTDTPEIFSASAGTPVTGTLNLRDHFHVGLALEKKPFNNKKLTEAIEADIHEFFTTNDGIAKALKARGAETPMNMIRPELEHVAGFKFPLERTADDLANRISELNIPEEFMDCIGTLVVLPLRDQTAETAAEQAIERLVGSTDVSPGQLELAIMFLPGVGRVIVIDQVRGIHWTFFREFKDVTSSIRNATISVIHPDGTQHDTRYWMVQRDAMDCAEAVACERRIVIEDALREFGLEAWAVGDRLPVTVALLMLPDGSAAPLGAPGRFCLGLPTQQSTGLPAHVDARFFATISRTALDFGKPYNSLLLDVATELLEQLLEHLRQSERLEDRRTVTLALHRSSGAFADRVFAMGGVADGKVILAWGGSRFHLRAKCRLPHSDEIILLGFIHDALPEGSKFLRGLPEAGLLRSASVALESLDLPALEATPHPWLQQVDDEDFNFFTSAIEVAAKFHRSDGPKFWEGFITSLLDCFVPKEIYRLRWLPVGSSKLATPSQRAFLPTAAEADSDEVEVVDVPTRIAGRIRLLDGTAITLRDGKGLSKLALRLDEKRLVRRPRKTELLELALFPELEKAAAEDGDAALELFGQAVSWIASMKEVSRKNLSCKSAMVPVVSPTLRGYSWTKASDVYLGEGWGLTAQHDLLLGKAYPDKRVMPLGTLRTLIELGNSGISGWRKAVETMGVVGVPRIIVFDKGRPPLKSYNSRLYAAHNLSLGSEDHDSTYQDYVSYIAKTTTTKWAHQFSLNVDSLLWIDGLEVVERRQHVVDLMLKHPESFRASSTVTLRRIDSDDDPRPVPSMWAFALSQLGWPVFPAEQGAGGALTRVSNAELWCLSARSRRAVFSRIINVVPHSFVEASALLEALGVSSMEDASPEKLFNALSGLALRLDDERMHRRQDALSLANELYGQIVERLEKNPFLKFPTPILLPLRRDSSLESVNPRDDAVLIVIDDEPSRSRHVAGIERAYRIPISRDASSDAIYSLFSRSFGSERVILTSTAKVDVHFTPSSKASIKFLDWLQQNYPRAEVAVELAAMLTFGNERSERSTRVDSVSRNWKAFERLELVFGLFGNFGVSGFYDRPKNRLWVSSSLQEHEIISLTWEQAGAWSRFLWMGYASALKDGHSRPFLHELGITEVEIVGVADDAGLHRATSVKGLAPAVLAARCHAVPGMTLDEAAAWLASVGDSAEDVAREFDRPDLVAVLKEALGLRFPDDELHVIRYLNVPWNLWQDAVQRRDTKRHVFGESVRRYQNSRSHLIAVAREIGVQESSIDLETLGKTIAMALAAPVPDSVKHLPLDASNAETIALREVGEVLSSFAAIKRRLDKLPTPPWEGNLPLSEGSTARGVRLFRDVEAFTRAIESTTSVKAVVQVAVRLAASLFEKVEPTVVLADAQLQARMQGEWAHVFAALSNLRSLLIVSAPETVKRLSAIQAFGRPSTLESLLRKLPDIPRTKLESPPPKQSVLGVDLTDAELLNDLSSGADGALGAILAEAAKRDLDPLILAGRRNPLPVSPGGGGSGGGGGGSGGWAANGKMNQEPQTVGDLGEALVHEWLGRKLGEHYGPDCWVSKARERYGLPKSGIDGLGYDFKVSDPEGRLFGKPVSTFLIEVKSTTTDGSGPFPMSSSEWNHARQCAQGDGETVYVILRVFEADRNPRIGDAVLNPFAAHCRGEVLLADKELWITVAPLVSD